MLHSKARGAHPSYPARFSVPDDRVPWSTAFPTYAPSEFTAGVVLKQYESQGERGWADPPTLTVEQFNKIDTFEQSLKKEESTGRPLNPRGRTGLRGRGLLGRWGANQAADLIVTRFDPSNAAMLQFVSIRRIKTKQWALPGGMVDRDERGDALKTARREFSEEAGAFDNSDREKRTTQNNTLDDANIKKLVYEGYVDDPRNTDNAWMETSGYHFHLGTIATEALPVRAGDDASAVRWTNVVSENLATLFASHEMLVRLAAEQLGFKVQ